MSLAPIEAACRNEVQAYSEKRETVVANCTNTHAFKKINYNNGLF